MNWIQNLTRAIDYIEKNLTNDISIDEVSKQAYMSSSHFQFVFHVVTGFTIGEYIRNRRLSLAAQDLLKSGEKVVDVASRYQYETPESFSKAFTRFHGMPPSKIQPGNVKTFYPLSLQITVKGGFDMSRKIIDEFYWSPIEDEMKGELTADTQYRKIISWAIKARGQNPTVFDALTEWVLDDSQWTEDKLAENEQILIHGVLARFKEQNTQLRNLLTELEPSGVVNKAVFKALDQFDNELSGNTYDDRLRETLTKVFSDFSLIKDSVIRKQIAGNKTGPTGTNSVYFFGYINSLKECDAAVQWALFMPDLVAKQQDGFKVDSFEYIKMPAMRFIGKEYVEHDEKDMRSELEIMRKLDSLKEFKSGFDHDVLFMHHYGLCVDTGPWRGFWGRFMKADTPVPEGFVYFDLVPENNGKPGAPFLSQFAYAVFSGDIEAMHKTEGYDSDAMYDVTRNIMLGQGVTIPYPDKYWTAEVFINGCDKPSTAYMFSSEQ